MFDLDSSIVPVFGRGKQGAAFGYTKVRGYHPQFATCAQTGMVLFSRSRGGAAGSARCAKSFLTETVSRLRNAGATGELTVRADSAFFSKAVLHTAVKLNVRFSVTIRQDKKIRAAIDAIDESAWQPIPYWLSTPETSGADVAETSYTAFSGKDAMTVRLIVRRVRPTPGSQLALFTTWDYHAFVTNRDGEFLEIQADHRRHAIVEQRIAELKSAGLAHLPSGKFMANAVWLALSVMAHNLGKAVGRLAGPDLDSATAATLRRKVFTVPGRLVSSARRLALRLPESWPWATAIEQAIEKIRGHPTPLLNNTPISTTRTSEKPADRRLKHAPPRHELKRPRSGHRDRRQKVTRWIRAKSAPTVPRIR